MKETLTIIFTILTFVSTFLGGLVSIRYKKNMSLILGFSAGVLIAVVAFDIFPEIIHLIEKNHLNPQPPMIALITGFLLFHIVEKYILIHHAQEEKYGHHKHPTVGIFSALALTAHSFLDGVGIGLGFQVSTSIGVLIALAVISHDFSDGLNTGSLMLLHKNSLRKTLLFIFFDALAPILGSLSTLLFSLPEPLLLLYLGFFAGFLLYISLSEILPEAHSEQSSFKTIGMTILGIVFIFLVTQFG